MKILLDKMELYFGKDKFKKTKNEMYLKYKNGFYNKSNKLCDNIKYIISKEKVKIKRDLLKWKNLILTSFNRIPIICPRCNILMECLFEVS